MSKFLTVVAVALAGLGIFSAASCKDNATAAGSDKKQRTFVMVPKGIHVYYEGCKEGFDAAGEKYGDKTDYRASKEFKVDQQIDIIESLISRKVDGITISANEDKALTNVINEAKKAGIKVITFDSPASAGDCYIGTMNEEAGHTAGLELIKLMNNEGELAVLQGNLASPNLNERMDGLRRALKEKNSKITIIGPEDVNSLKQEAQNKTEALMQAHPNLKAIFGLSAECVPGAAPAVKEKGKAGQIIVGGFDDDPDTLAGIKAGTVQFCLAQKTYAMGWLSVKELNALCDGQSIPRQIDTGVIVINKDNVDGYKEQIKKEIMDMK